MSCRFQTIQVLEGEVRNVAVDFAGKLDAGELLTGTPTITADGLTISSENVNSAAKQINSRTAEPGQAVLFTVSGQRAGQKYDITITVGTDAGQTLVAAVSIEGV